MKPDVPWLMVKVWAWCSTLEHIRTPQSHWPRLFLVPSSLPLRCIFPMCTPVKHSDITPTYLPWPPGWSLGEAPMGMKPVSGHCTIRALFNNSSVYPSQLAHGTLSEVACDHYRRGACILRLNPVQG